MATSTPNPTYSSLTPQQKAQIAFMRFGLGPKPGGPARLGTGTNSARDALIAEIRNPGEAVIPDSAVQFDGAPLTYARCCAIGRSTTSDMTGDVIAQERIARFSKHLAPEVGFLERLVLFWSNHFSVYSKKGSIVRATVGHMERAAIRRNVLGKFSDMLKDVVTHTAMICYLDNDRSFGMTSVRNKWEKDKTKVTYNENLAREILELHTVGYDGGYTQEDVTNFAKILTGWTVYPRSDATASVVGQFCFDPNMHEQGAFTVMGQTFAQAGMDQGLAVLDMLATHPATAKHIARKLLQHFVCDQPDQASIDFLARRFTSTGGNLQAVATALISMEKAWTAPMSRLRQPYPWIISQVRGMGLGRTQIVALQDNLDNLLVQLNHGVWGRLTPDGFPDENFEWLSPNTVRLRKDAAGALVYNTYAKDQWQGSAEGLASSLLPEGLSPETAAALAPFGDPRQALAMLFVTPEYMRR